MGRDMHHFCPSCMTWMFTRPPGIDLLVNVRAPVLDDHLWVVPFVETFTAEGFAWARTAAPHSFETMPDMAGWQESDRGLRDGRRAALSLSRDSLPDLVHDGDRVRMPNRATAQTRAAIR